MQCHSLFKNKHRGYYWKYMPLSVLLIQPFWLVLQLSVGDVHVKYYGTLHQMPFNELLQCFLIKCIFIKAYVRWSDAAFGVCMQLLQEAQIKRRLVIYSALNLYISKEERAVQNVRKAAPSPWFKFTHSSAQWELTATSKTIWWRHLWGEPID